VPWWELGLDAIGLVLLLLALYGIALIARRRLLSRHGGTFELSYRARTRRPGRGWVLGLGRYSGDDLEWFRIFSLSPRPNRIWPRSDLEYADRRPPTGNEQISLFAGHLVITCETPDGVVELAMGAGSLTGFQAWLEAMPPGSRGVRPGDAPEAM